MNENGGKHPTRTVEGGRAIKRPYRSPRLTEYGSVEDLVDAGVVGSAASVPSITMKPPPLL
jgi:hypothetical protein